MSVDYCMATSPYGGFEVAHLLMQRLEYSVNSRKRIGVAKRKAENQRTVVLELGS